MSLRKAQRRKPALTPAPIAPPARKLWRALGALGLTVIVLGLALIYPWMVRGEAWFYAEWQSKWALLALIAVPPVWWWSTFGQDQRRPRLKIGTTIPLRRAPRGWRVRLRDLPGILRAVAIAFFALALARPVSVLSDATGEERGIDIVVVLDLSGSMQAILDAEPEDLPAELRPKKNQRLTRLDTAKVVVQDFISRRQTDRIGAVVFGSNAYLLSPPTLDYALLSKLISQLELNVIDGGQTALGDALFTAVARLRRSDAQSKVVILMTDGFNTGGRVSPDKAIEAATTHGAKVYTIQIGDGAEVEVLNGYSPFGKPIYGRARYPTDPALLKKISDKTGGEAFIATDAKALRESMHSILDQLEKTRFEASVAHYEDLFPFLLIPGVVLIGLEALLRSLLLRRFP